MAVSRASRPPPCGLGSVVGLSSGREWGKVKWRPPSHQLDTNAIRTTEGTFNVVPTPVPGIFSKRATMTTMGVSMGRL